MSIRLWKANGWQSNIPSLSYWLDESPEVDFTENQPQGSSIPDQMTSMVKCFARNMCVQAQYELYKKSG